MNKTMPYKPLSRDVVFKIEVVESAIVLSDELVKQSMLDDQNSLEVVAVGPECKHVKVGDLVLLRSPRYTSIAINQMEYGQISEGELLGIVDKNTDTSYTKAMKDRLTQSQAQRLGDLRMN